MGNRAESFVERLTRAGAASQSEDSTSHEIIGPHTAKLFGPELVTDLEPPTEEEIILARVREEFMQRMQYVYSLRPVGEIDELVSQGSFPTARKQFYPEIIIGPVTDWLYSDNVMPRALRGERLELAEFERYYQGQPKHDSLNWLWEKHVNNHKPENGQWR